jgi:hypothetical protein
MKRIKYWLLSAVCFFSMTHAFAECLEPFCAVDVSVSATEAATVVIGDDEILLENFSEAFEFVYSISSAPAKGTVTNNNDGTFTFDPNSEFDELATGESELVSFTFHISSEGYDNSNTATVTITVNGEGAVPDVTVTSDIRLYDEFNEDGVLSAGEQVHVGFRFHANVQRDDFDYFIDDWSDYLELVHFDADFYFEEQDIFDYLPRHATSSSSIDAFLSTSSETPRIQIDTDGYDVPAGGNIVIHALFQVKENVTLTSVPDITAKEVSYFPTTTLHSASVSLPLDNAPEPQVLVFKQSEPLYSDGEITFHLMVRNPIGSVEGDINANSQIQITQTASDTTFNCSGVRLKTEDLASTLSSGSISVSCTGGNQTIDVDVTGMALPEGDFLVIPVAIAFSENPYSGIEWQFSGSVSTVGEGPILLVQLLSLKPISPTTGLFNSTSVLPRFTPPEHSTASYSGAFLDFVISNETYEEYENGSARFHLELDSDLNCDAFMKIEFERPALTDDIFEVSCEGSRLVIQFAEIASSDNFDQQYEVTLREQFGELLDSDTSKFEGFVYMSLNDQAINIFTPIDEVVAYDQLTKEEEKKEESISFLTAMIALGFAVWFGLRRAQYSKNKRQTHSH